MTKAGSEEQFLDIFDQIKSLQRAQAQTRRQVEEVKNEVRQDLDEIKKELSLLQRLVRMTA
jgi:regulator of replication initiation timing